MSQIVSDLKRIGSASGLYAVGEMLNRGMAFLLLPVYTRFLPQAEYGTLDLLNVLSGVLFAVLLLGMPSALTKVFHRDCDGPEQQSRAFATAMALDLPVLLLGGGVLFWLAEPVGRWVIGQEGQGPLVRLVIATAVSASLIAIVLSSFRTRERALAFVALNFLQFVPAMALNIVLVVHMGLGVRGVLVGNLLSSLIALPVGLWMVRRKESFRFDPRLVRPLFRFGVLLIPVGLASWIVDLSDRWVLRLYTDLEEIAVYGVGYKIGMILQMAIVWPFQLAWPSVSFSISKRSGHETTYARTTTYLLFVLCLGALGLSLTARSGLPVLTGEAYREAISVVPWVALAYLFNGLHYCLTPGIHVEGRTRYLTVFSSVAAAANLGLNFLLVPRFGVLGAAWATTITFCLLAVLTYGLSQRVHPAPHEWGRWAKIAGCALVVFALGVLAEPEGSWLRFGWHLGLAVVGFPLLTLLTGWIEPEERDLLRSLGKTLRARIGGRR